MKVLVINCGSSSLKYQLIDMDGEKVLCKGLCERIGMESSTITHEANGNKATTPAIFPTHTEAFHELIKKMTTGAGKCIEDVGEINAIGHRIVHGGEKFQSSCVITDEVVDALRELRSEEHTSELQSRFDLVCRLLLEKKKILGLVHQRT